MPVDSLGVKLIKLRNKHGMNQSQFAVKLRINESQYSKYEREVFYPDIQVLMRISIILDIPIDDLTQDLRQKLKMTYLACH